MRYFIHAQISHMNNGKEIKLLNCAYFWWDGKMYSR